MFTLIRGGTVYSPENFGVRDILVAGGTVAAISESLDVSGLPNMVELSARGKFVVPGFIDLHVHILGGGGEGGFGTRTPEIRLSRIVSSGVTTVVGCLGTDDVSRRPETLLAKALQLEAEGISTFIYTGSYQLPLPTITGSIRKDIALIPKVVGVGELAVSDHRSSQPTFDELCRIAAEARVGGMIGGKAGLVHLHLGDGPRGLDPVFRILRETEIPIDQFLPTHVTRKDALFDQAIAFARMGGHFDITTGGGNLEFSIDTGTAVERALEAGIGLDKITLSSDSNGSLPLFDGNGNLLRLAVADIGTLFSDWKGLVSGGIDLSDALKMVTVNPARRLGLLAGKGTIEEGKDADLVILDPDLNIDTVLAKGHLMVQGGKVLARGTFEVWEESE